LTVIRQLERVLGAEKLAAIDDGRNAGVRWIEIADSLGQEYAGSAKNLRDRLYAATTNPEGPRTARAGRRAEADRLAAEDRERREELQVARVAGRRHKEVQAVARALVANAEDLCINDDAAMWLSGVRTLLSVANPTARQQQSLAAQVSLTAAEIFLHASVNERPPASTDEARVALNEARAIR
jgi:hypothetical protein